jgi:hypothetical protein
LDEPSAHKFHHYFSAKVEDPTQTFSIPRCDYLGLNWSVKWNEKMAIKVTNWNTFLLQQFGGGLRTLDLETDVYVGALIEMKNLEELSIAVPESGQGVEVIQFVPALGSFPKLREATFWNLRFGQPFNDPPDSVLGLKIFALHYYSSPLSWQHGLFQLVKSCPNIERIETEIFTLILPPDKRADLRSISNEFANSHTEELGWQRMASDLIGLSLNNHWTEFFLFTVPSTTSLTSLKELSLQDLNFSNYSTRFSDLDVKLKYLSIVGCKNLDVSSLQFIDSSISTLIHLTIDVFQLSSSSLISLISRFQNQVFCSLYLLFRNSTARIMEYAFTPLHNRSGPPASSPSFLSSTPTTSQLKYLTIHWYLSTRPQFSIPHLSNLKFLRLLTSENGKSWNSKEIVSVMEEGKLEKLKWLQVGHNPVKLREMLKDGRWEVEVVGWKRVTRKIADGVEKMVREMIERD